MKSNKKYEDCLKWRENFEWYDLKNEQYVLTDKAPAEARRSFEQWKELTEREDYRRELERIWRTDSDWYYYDEDLERYFLTEKAPDEARRSFEQWKKINGIKWGEEGH